MKLIVQLRKNAYAFEVSCARVQIRSAEDLEDDEEELDEDEEANLRQDPSGSVYCQVERSGPDVDFANPHHCDEVRAKAPAFGFGRH